MKRAIVKISVAVSCLILVAVMVMPVLASTTYSFDGNLPAWGFAGNLVTDKQKVNPQAEYAGINVSALGNSNTDVFLYVMQDFNGSSLATNIADCVIGYNIANYSALGWTGPVDLRGYAEYFGPGPERVIGNVDFY